MLRIFNSLREYSDMDLSALKLMVTSQVPSLLLTGLVTVIWASGKFPTEACHENNCRGQALKVSIAKAVESTTKADRSLRRNIARWRREKTWVDWIYNRPSAIPWEKIFLHAWNGWRDAMHLHWE